MTRGAEVCPRTLFKKNIGSFNEFPVGIEKKPMDIESTSFLPIFLREMV
jgi:hypothetical protein